MRLFFFPVWFACSISLSLAGKGWEKHVVHQGQAGRGSVNVAVADDFDGDGQVDVIASFDGGVVLFKGPDWKSRSELCDFTKDYAGSRKLRPSCIHGCLLDVDGDGDQDFVGSNQLVFWLECPDKPFDGPWKFRIVDEKILGTHCLITGDVDRDGRLDLIANSGRSEGHTPFPDSITWQKIPENPRSAKSWERHVFAHRDAPGASHYMGFGDVNGDGRPDIACGAKGGEQFPGGEWFAWWEQPKDPTKRWRKHLLSDKQPGASNIIPADLNGDGQVDYFATRGHGKGVLWFKGPKFEPLEIDPDLDGPHCLALADLDADGDVDAVTCGRNLDGLAVWYENNGKAGFTRRLLGRNQGSYDIRTVDLDADGDLDVLIAGHFNANVVWYENPLK
jgi:hypothetical protein